jgi:hypothetical protein
MHKYNKLFFSVLLFLAACISNTVPDGIIKEDQMVSLLTDLHIVDGSMYTVMQQPDSLYKHGTGRYLAIFKKYNTDSVGFKKSFKYYCSNPETLETMYQQITATLKLKTDSINKLYQQKSAADNKRYQDSMSKLPKQAPQQVSPAKPLPPLPPNRYPRIHPPKRHVEPS